MALTASASAARTARAVPVGLGGAASTALAEASVLACPAKSLWTSAARAGGAAGAAICGGGGELCLPGGDPPARLFHLAALDQLVALETGKGRPVPDDVKVYVGE